MVPRDQDRDRLLEQLLRQSAGDPSPSPDTGACVDGETLAAWTAGALRSAEAAAVETHLANCARCQSMVATFARTAPFAPAAETWWRRSHVRWLVPLATAATVAAIWVAIPGDRPSRNAAEMAERSDVERKVAAEPPAASTPAPPATSPRAPAPAAKPDAILKDEDQRTNRLARQSNRPAEPSAQRRARAESDQVTAPSAAGSVVGGAREERLAAAAPPVPAAAPDRAAAVTPSPAQSKVREETVTVTGQTPIVVASPTTTNRWRIGGASIDYSTDAGARWEPAAIAASEELTAMHSPASTIAWVVGRRGAVYLTTDGSRFVRVPFVEPVDLIAVRAIDDRQATVTASDGRTFRTTDRGQTWTPGAP